MLSVARSVLHSQGLQNWTTLYDASSAAADGSLESLVISIEKVCVAPTSRPPCLACCALTVAFRLALHAPLPLNVSTTSVDIASPLPLTPASEQTSLAKYDG